MKKFCTLFFFFSLIQIYGQNEFDRKNCKNNFYEGEIIKKNKIYEIDSVVRSNILSISKSQIQSISTKITNEDILLAIKSIKENPIYTEMCQSFSATVNYDSTCLNDFSTNFKGTEKYRSYINNNDKIEKLANEILNDNKYILHMSLYSVFKDFGDCYFFQLGWDRFSYKVVSNSMINSILFGWSKTELLNYQNNLIGVELRESGQIVTIPIVDKGEYICDIRLILCDGSTPRDKPE